MFFSLPFAFIALDPRSGFGVVAWIGIAVWTLGNVGTIVSDRQLAQWRANPENKGKTARPWRLVELVTSSELLLRVGELVRERARRDDRADGLDRVDRPRRPALPPVPRHRNPGDEKRGSTLALGLRRVPADDERLRPAPAAKRDAVTARQPDDRPRPDRKRVFADGSGT